MTSLRMRVVEAGAREYESLVDADAEDASWRSTEEYFLHVFDAMLDCLTENADEWKTHAWEFPALGLTEAMIEALREDR